MKENAFNFCKRKPQVVKRVCDTLLNSGMSEFPQDITFVSYSCLEIYFYSLVKKVFTLNF